MNPRPVHTDSCGQVESWLKRRGVNYRGPFHAPLDAFNERKSLVNQARPEALDAETVDRYATAMKAAGNADDFPPVVAYLVAGKLVVIDGNHRYAAAKRVGLPSVLTIGVDPDTTSSEMIYLLTVEANSTHGKPTDTKWRIAQAMHLVDLGVAQDLAIEATGIRERHLQDAIATRKADERARSLGITGFAQLSDGVRQAIGSLRDDPVMVVAAKIAMSNKLNVTDTRNLVRDIKRLGSEGERLAALATFDEERQMERAVAEVTNRRSRTTNPKLGLTTGLGKVLAFDIDKIPWIFTQTTERNEMLRRIDEVVDHLAKIQAEIVRIAREDREDPDAIAS